MRRTLRAFAAVALGLVAASQGAVAIEEEEEYENGVLILTDQNYDDMVAKYDNLLVEFYAPWW